MSFPESFGCWLRQSKLFKSLSGKLKCQTMGDFSDEGGKINLPISKLVDRRIKDLKQSTA
jgi:hypothetical protein